MSDPFEILRAELLKAAAARVQPQSAQRRRWWLPGRSRPLAVAIAALVICGSATAAALSLWGSTSQPLAGTIPGRPAGSPSAVPLSVAGDGYRVTVFPDLDAGAAGWSTAIAYIGSPFGSAAVAGGGYPTLSDPLFGGSGVSLIGVGDSRRSGDSLGFELTGPQVAAIRLGARTIRTFSSTQLPTGDRAAVFFIAAGSPEPTVGWRPGDPIGSKVRVPAGPWKSVAVPSNAVLPLDDHGNIIPVIPSTAGPAPSSFWQAPSAVTPTTSEPAYNGVTSAGPSVCELTQHGLPKLTPEWGHTITTLPIATDSIGELFVSCIDTTYYLDGWPLTAAILLDARQPGKVLGPLPDTQAVAGDPDLVNLDTAAFSARKAGNAWIVVRGGSGAAQRLRVLQALQISRLATQP